MISLVLNLLPHGPKTSVIRKAFGYATDPYFPSWDNRAATWLPQGPHPKIQGSCFANRGTKMRQNTHQNNGGEKLMPLPSGRARDLNPETELTQKMFSEVIVWPNPGF